MDFGKILDDWENGKRKEGTKRENPMHKLVDSYGPAERDILEKEKADEKASEAASRRRSELLRMKPEAVIDLHGLTADEAIKQADAFLRKCKNEGVKKALLIHGKGLHSDSIPVLGKKIVQFVQRCRYAGEYGVAPKEWGGRGATWVILR
jgi:DNA-nicking Smr family endonuclease